MSTDLTNAVTYLAYVVGAGLLWLAIAEVRAAWRQTSRANLEAVMKRHPAGKGQDDPARVEQMAAIAAEEAWDRDVWGTPAKRDAGLRVLDTVGQMHPDDVLLARIERVRAEIERQR